TPLSKSLIKAAERLLARRRARTPLQIAAAAALLRTTGLEGKAAAGVVRALIARCGRGRSLDRLRQLAEQVGPSAAVRDCFQAIEDRIEISCPRCHVSLKRPQMARHLWFEHQLLLDGRQALRPWPAIKEWIKAYRRGGNAELLVRCRMLGQQLDPER